MNNYDDNHRISNMTSVRTAVGLGQVKEALEQPVGVGHEATVHVRRLLQLLQLLDQGIYRDNTGMSQLSTGTTQACHSCLQGQHRHVTVVYRDNTGMSQWLTGTTQACHSGLKGQHRHVTVVYRDNTDMSQGHLQGKHRHVSGLQGQHRHVTRASTGTTQACHKGIYRENTGMSQWSIGTTQYV